MKVSELSDMWLHDELKRQQDMLRRSEKAYPGYDTSPSVFAKQIARTAVVRRKIIALVERELAEGLTPNEDMNQN